MFDHDVDSQPTKTKDPGGRPRSLLSVRFPEVSAPAFIAMLIVLIGIVIGATVLGLDIPNQMTAQSERFYKVADEAFLKFVSALENYKVSGIWLHEACQNRKMSFKEFRGVYEHITSTGLEFQGISCALNVTSSERPFYENQTRAYLAGNYPTASYAGFMGCRPATEEGDCQIGRRRNASYYLVTHFVEPLEDFWNLVTLDFDMMTTWHQRKIIFQALETNSLSVTERLQYLPPPDDESDAYQYSLMMVHPGIPHKRNDSLQLRPSEDIAIVVVRFVALLLKAHQKYKVDEETMIYVYDSTKSVIDEKGQPLFLGGAKIGKGNLTITPEISFTDLQQADINLREDKVLSIAERQWTFVAVAPQGAYEPEYFLIVFGALMIVVASTCAALWIYSISKARAEKTAILLESAEKAAKSERELNDFIAHEVRNPLSAAISANAFVSILVNESKPLVAQEAESVREDVKVIGNSLQYINDLLRSMLDSHRAQSQQILIEMRHVDIRNDVFKYVASILYRRGCTYEIIIDCPEELVVMSDPLRLKQIILNLALNSAKFVDRGFLRMGASVNDGMICLYVDDSGPGIPVEKRHHLFAKFQQSLDTLHQGTGIGLSLCKQLIELMGGEISLDESYESGIEACPGARFLIALNTPPHQWEATQDEFDVSIHTEDETSSGTAASESCSLPPTVVQTAPDLHDLPENLSVLFVDDDFILRKLFIRSVKRYRPNWTLFESASGEAALQLVEERGQEGMFDLIFMDQYMASTQKQLLGTETIRLLRSKGVTSILCGLSANNLGSQFKDAGADCFMLKPLPCETNELARTLHRVLHSREQAEESSGS